MGGRITTVEQREAEAINETRRIVEAEAAKNPGMPFADKLKLWQETEKRIRTEWGLGPVRIQTLTGTITADE
jgi:hypothetical protein